MNCQDCQNAICELMEADGDLPSQPAIEQHLAECPACRDFHAAWPALDTSLAHRFMEVPLPAEFKASLFAKLPALEPRPTPAALAARRKKLEQEYREALASLNKRYLIPQVPGVLRVAILTAGGSFAGVALAGIILSLPFSDAAAPPAFAALIAQGLCSAIGLTVGILSLRRTWRHSLRSVLPPSLRRFAAL